ncbi:MAG: hypothetical protein PUC39_03815 [Lachnospiraceae bacterium]|nr:hypothetical protein [Lachnospiraceae bacterium]
MGVVCLLLGGCSNREIKADAKYKVMVICKGSQHEFWQTARMGAEDACEELGMDMVFKAPENETQVDVQIQMMETAIQSYAKRVSEYNVTTDILPCIWNRLQ